MAPHLPGAPVAGMQAGMSSPAPSHATAAGRERAAFTQGLLVMVGAMVILPAMDALAKYLSATVSPAQLGWARFAFQTLLMLPLVVRSAGWRGLLPRRPWLNACRGALIAVSGTSFFAAVKYMPLADAMAIFFVAPFILTLLSALVLGEPVGWRRRSAVAVGFVGALIVIRPSYGVFGWVALLPLATAALFSVYLVLSRRAAAADSAAAMQFSAGLAATVVMSAVLAAGTLLGAPELMAGRAAASAWALMAAIGALATVGHLMVVHAFRVAPASVLAPFQYLEIVSATVLGYLLFGDFPDGWKWLGIAVIVGCGIYVYWRESRVR